ncbi:MAG: AGE family epimerase/isomerase [Planctomycetota bacterium]
MTGRDLHDLKGFVLGTLLPRWKERGIDGDGAFYERLDAGLEPIDLGYRRLLAQCRQIFTFAEGALLGGGDELGDAAARAFGLLRERYHAGEGRGWRFAVGEHPSVPAATRDLYAHAFVLLACASMHRLVGGPEPLATARETLDFLRMHFAAPAGGGFAEALDDELRPLPRVRRQNPHMHLLEGCLMMYDASGDAAYADLADELVQLFATRFFHEPSGTLGEFFDDELRPHAKTGTIVEPGHHFEWIWLLDRRAALDYRGAHSLAADELWARAERLLHWAVERGHDADAGGYFDEADRDGTPLKDSKRIWPITEALKAFAAARRRLGDAWAAHQSATLGLLFERYLRGDTGGWNEVLRRDLSPEVDYLPATTLYHVMMGLRESLAIEAAS